MLIETIKFEIRDFKNGTSEEFCIANTEGAFALIASHRNTRAIEFVDMFDFEFIAKKTPSPKFIRFGVAALRSLVENEMLEEIDLIDEMVGIY